MDEKAKAILSELSRGVHIAFENAEQLFKEADLLREKGHHARAVVLHQISIEECGKIEIIGGHAMGLFLEGRVDLAVMAKAFRKHKAKNYANAYFIEIRDEELEARKARNVKAALEAFKNLQSSFHKDSNDAKNAGLYVDFIDGKFIAPGDVIDAKMAEGYAAVNHYFLSMTWPKVSMIDNLLQDDGRRRKALTQLIERVKRMRDEKEKDPQAVLDEMLKEMLDEFKKEPGGNKE